MNTENLFFEVKKAFLAKDNRQNFLLVDEKKALNLFFRLFAKERIDELITDKIIDLLRYEYETEKNFLAQRLAGFLAYFLKHDFLIETNEEEFLKISPTKLSQNTFIAYWTILSYANTKGLSVLPNYTQGNLLDKFCLLVKKSKPYRLNLANQNLRQANLTYVELEEANFTKCDLAGASFMYSSLKKCNFHNASLDLANLTEANLEGANLSFTSLRESILLKTDVKKASIHSCDFQNAELSEADFSESELKQSNFGAVEANYMNFSKCNIENCDFSYANLYKSDFKNTRFYSSKITQADLYASIWEYVEVLNIEFDVNTLESAVFKYTFLDEVNTEIVKKKGAVIEE